jgi:hypothetical protein
VPDAYQGEMQAESQRQQASDQRAAASADDNHPAHMLPRPSPDFRSLPFTAEYQAIIGASWEHLAIKGGKSCEPGDWGK